MEEAEAEANGDAAADREGEGGRRICSGVCERPVKVCLCDKIPSEAMSTKTKLVILQHPHEVRQRLATVPVLTKCLSGSHLIVGRLLRLGFSPLLDSLYLSTNANAIFLFPGSKNVPSVDINQWKSSLPDSSTDGCVLIVFDATWKHAKEMMTASLPFLSKFATCVCFNCDFQTSGGSIYDSDLILKKEPFRGCMSTMEAVARALRVVDPDGIQIEAKLVDVLKSMVHLQACHLKNMKSRPRLLKKGLEKNKILGHNS